MFTAPQIGDTIEKDHAIHYEAADENRTEVLSTEPIALLINIITRHQHPQFAAARRHLPRMQCLLSAANEPHRDYDPDFSLLEVSIQKSWTVRKKWKHSAGFADDLNVHIPYDTPAWLHRMRPRAVLSFELGFRTLCAAMHRRTHRRCGLAIVVNESEHTAGSWGLARRMLRPMLLNSADVVTYNGSSGRRYLRDRMRVPEQKLLHVPYTAHPGMLFTGGTNRPATRRHRMLYVGQLTERKNPLAFLRCLMRWCADHPSREVELSMAGRGPLVEPIRELVKPANFRLELLGAVPPENLPGVYQTHGLMVFPTLADEWGLVVNESMHSGLPVLSSIYAQATLDLIREGENGWRFAPDDDAASYAGIDRALSSSVNRVDAMAAAARLSVADRTPLWSGRLLAEAARAAIDRTA